MIGHINITGQIGTFDDVKGVELIDVITQVQKQRAAESFYVYIDSPGGGVDDGDSIYSYLKSLPQRIVTVGFGRVASIASKVMFAGEERIMIEGQSGVMIHNPWVANVVGDANELLSVSEDIRKVEDDLISFYSEGTGISKEGLTELMKRETDMSPERALELGFATKVISKEKAIGMGMIFPGVIANVKALAFRKEKEAKKENTMSKEISDKLDKVLTFLNLKKEEKPVVKVMTVSDSNGTELTITKADGSEVEGNPSQGDLITVGGQAGEGSYILPDMKITITAKAGVIESVVEDQPAAPAADPELEQAKTDLAAAQAKVVELESAVKNHESFKLEVENKFALIEKGLKASHSNYVPQARVTDFGKGNEESPLTISKQGLKERKESYKNKTK
jgi:ATP-dependent Clp protease protease subunit